MIKPYVKEDLARIIKKYKETEAMTFPDPDYNNVKDENGLYDYRILSLTEMNEPKVIDALKDARNPMAHHYRFAKLPEQKITLVKQALDNVGLDLPPHVMFIWNGRFSTDVFKIQGKAKLERVLEILDPVDAEIQNLNQQIIALIREKKYLQRRKVERDNGFLPNWKNFDSDSGEHYR